MGWHNPPIPWPEFERRLSGRNPVRQQIDDLPRSRRRPRFAAQDVPRPEGLVVPYAELHAHSYFSFLDGASSPEEMIQEAARLGLTGLALTDHDGLYGAPLFAEAAESFPELLTVYGAELSLGLTEPQNGKVDPEGEHLLVLAKGVPGYYRLSRAITEGQLAEPASSDHSPEHDLGLEKCGGRNAYPGTPVPETAVPGSAVKGRPVYRMKDLAEQAAGQWFILTGCRKGQVRRALAEGMLHHDRPADQGAGALLALEELTGLFGAENILVELYDHGLPEHAAQNDLLAQIAEWAGVRTVATNNVHYTKPGGHRLAAALAAVRARRSLAELDGWLACGPSAFLRSGAEMAARFARFPEAVARTVQIAREAAFPLAKARPRLPKLDLPEGHTQMSYLRQEVWKGAANRYRTLSREHRDRLEYELAVIAEKDFPGYFLMVKELVDFAQERDILCQGRGSAAASAVCYVLGITAIDPILYRLPFERFLNASRDEEPDIDVDFDARRREEVIQHVYETYGRRNAAQVCTVISYRPKFAVRDMAKALGYSSGQQDAWSKQLENPYGQRRQPENDIPQDVRELANQVSRFPRHLGIHSGGMVLTEQPVSEICPVEHARMPGRTVLQWDKSSCAYMGLVKFDLLGLGMLSALKHCGEHWTLATLPKEEEAVYDQLCLADSIGVFQVESRAQMSMLPRLRPREFYDLVIEVALVRPGPIQGGAVHPYMRRRNGTEKISYAHSSVRPVLERTKGVPIFQEQLMQMAIALGGCDAQDADLLRRAMGSKRGVEKIESIKAKLFEGMRAKGIDEMTAAQVYGQIAAFAEFGFAESHALSFALLVYASAWLRMHYPAAFLAALLRSQPMGFYSGQTLVEDARRHGVQVRGVDVDISEAQSGLEPLDSARLGSNRSGGMPECLQPDHGKPGPFRPENFPAEAVADFSAHRRDTRFAVRLGLAEVGPVSIELAERIVAERERGGSFRDLADLSRRPGLSTAQLEALAKSGALESLVPGRRAALWQAGPASRERQDQLPGTAPEYQAPPLPIFTAWDALVANLQSTGIAPADHPLRHLRPGLRRRGVLSAQQLRSTENGRRVQVAGLVTHRQRPATANSTTFINLEDETGLVNVVCSEGAWARYRRIVRDCGALVVRGVLERSTEGVVNLLADSFEPLELSVRTRSRDFQ